MKASRALAVAVAVGLGALLSNPSPARHREQVRQAVADRNPLAGALGLGAMTAFVTSYHPLGLASYTTVGDRVVSIGAFGLVHVRDAAP